MHEYDANIHCAVAHLLVLFGSIPVHFKHGAPVIFFSPAGTVKFWVKVSTPAFGFFLNYTLDKVVCPYLANPFGICIFHPTTEEKEKALLDATVDV